MITSEMLEGLYFTTIQQMADDWTKTADKVRNTDVDLWDVCVQNARTANEYLSKQREMIHNSHVG